MFLTRKSLALIKPELHEQPEKAQSKKSLNFCTNTCLRLLVHLPDGVVLDGQDDEPSRVLLEERLVHFKGLELLADLAADGRRLLDRGLDNGVGLHRGLDVRTGGRVLLVLRQVKVADLGEGHVVVNDFTVSGQKKSF